LENLHLSKSNSAETSAIVIPFSYSCIDQVSGKNSHLNIFVFGFLMKYSANISIQALLALSRDSLFTGMCFLLSVVHDDAENCHIFSGRIIFSFFLDSCIYVL
jgi:hypothetical protein